MLFPFDEPGTTKLREFLLGVTLSEVEHENIANAAIIAQNAIAIFFIGVKRFVVDLLLGLVSLR